MKSKLFLLGAITISLSLIYSRPKNATSALPVHQTQTVVGQFHKCN
jgi:hypothetical protein